MMRAKEVAIRVQKFEEAVRLSEEAERLRKLSDEMRQEWKKTKEANRPTIKREDVTYIISKMTGIPLTKMEEGEAKKLLSMESELTKRVVGQNEAISAISRAIRRSRAGLKGKHCPIGSFIFLGPTGVGKTELARALAAFLFDTEEALIRVDMSEYMEKFASSRLVGAPPGYVGYEEGGQLTEKVRRRPYSVVLFDEIEKAHPDVFNLLLQVLDDGYLTDSVGRKIDFKNTVLIMTSNLGSKMFDRIGAMGFHREGDIDRHGSMKKTVQTELKNLFHPEFLNRIDDIITFHPLSKKHLESIVEILLADLNVRLSEQGMQLLVSHELKNWLIDTGFDPDYGARPMRRCIQKNIEDPLSEAILSGQFTGCRVILGVLKENAPAFVVEDDLLAKSAAGGQSELTVGVGCDASDNAT